MWGKAEGEEEGENDEEEKEAAGAERGGKGGGHAGRVRVMVSKGVGDLPSSPRSCPS